MSLIRVHLIFLKFNIIFNRVIQGLDMETTFGSGFSIINNDGHFPQEELITLVNVMRTEIFKKRCDALAKCIHIDRILGNFINYFFNIGEPEKQVIFSQLIGTQPFFSFRVRKQIVLSLIEDYPQHFQNIVNKEQIKTFANTAENIINIRNLLAHGELLLDLKEKNFKIVKYSLDDLEKKTKTLDSEFFEKFDADIQFIINFCTVCQVAYSDTLRNRTVGSEKENVIL